MKIMPNRLDRLFIEYQKELEQKALDVLRSGWYVLGKEVEAFEQEFASYTGAKYCVGLANGLDALWISIRNLGIGPGDEVIVQGNTYIASVMGITINGATPVFVEPDEYYNIDVNKIEEKITPRTKAILVVHLYGQAAQMDKIVELANRYNLEIVEDCAQSHGACFNGQMTGTFGEVGCFSFYPSKNLGAFGDGGAIVTNNAKLAEKIKIFRNYGSERRYYNKVIGANSRLDELQAGLLRVKLKYISKIVNERTQIANEYLRGITNESICLPIVRENAGSVWHQFVVRVDKRKELLQFLEDRGVGTIIHYPIPPHLSEAYSYLKVIRGSLPITEKYADSVLSIPMYNGMTVDEQKYIISTINSWRI